MRSLTVEWTHTVLCFGTTGLSRRAPVGEACRINENAKTNPRNTTESIIFNYGAVYTHQHACTMDSIRIPFPSIEIRTCTRRLRAGCACLVRWQVRAFHGDRDTYADRQTDGQTDTHIHTQRVQRSIDRSIYTTVSSRRLSTSRDPMIAGARHSIWSYRSERRTELDLGSCRRNNNLLLKPRFRRR